MHWAIQRGTLHVDILVPPVGIVFEKEAVGTDVDAARWVSPDRFCQKVDTFPLAIEEEVDVFVGRSPRLAQKAVHLEPHIGKDA